MRHSLIQALFAQFGILENVDALIFVPKGSDLLVVHFVELVINDLMFTCAITFGVKSNLLLLKLSPRRILELIMLALVFQSLFLFV